MGWLTSAVTADAIMLLGALFDDIGVRAPIGVTWVADSRHPPMAVDVTAAGHPGRSFRLPDTDPADAVVPFAAEVQDWLIPLLGVAVPPCPSDGLGLLPQRSESGPGWVCPEADFECGFGEYLLALWPPGDGEPEVTMMLAARLQHRGVRFTGVGIKRRSGSMTAEIEMYDGADEAAARAAAAPYVAELSWAAPVTTERFLESTADGTYRGLRLCGGGPVRLALAVGPLGRASEADGCDVLIGGNAVRLEPDHRIGGPGEALIIDADGVPFADEGEIASCGGGFGGGSHVRGEHGPFYAWQITVKDS
jgi:hypothetical protein